jgi:hypothetical protein
LKLKHWNTLSSNSKKSPNEGFSISSSLTNKQIRTYEKAYEKFIGINSSISIS